MKLIYEQMRGIKEELADATKYAEDYVLAKVMRNPSRAKLYWDMASDELRHSTNMMSIAGEDIASIEAVTTLPEEDKEAWEYCTRHYAEAQATIKKMLEG